MTCGVLTAVLPALLSRALAVGSVGIDRDAIPGNETVSSPL